MSLFDDLQKAIEEGNVERIEVIKNKLLNGYKDDKLDKELIENIKGKTLYKNMIKAVNDIDDKIDKIWYIKLCSSLLTHNVIEAEISGNSMDEYPIKDLYVLLGKFITDSEVNNSTGEINKIGETDVKKEFRKLLIDRYSQFF